MGELEVRYRYRLRVNRGQAAQLQAVFDACRFVWNQALGRWQDLWRHEGVNLSYRNADRELTDWRGRFEWLRAEPSVPQQQTIRDLYRAIAAFFDSSNPARRPRFKTKGSHAKARWTTRGFAVSGSGRGERGDRLAVAVAGGRVELRPVWSRPLPSTATSVTVYRDQAGRWWASFVVREPLAERVPTARSTGVDVGLNTFATTTDPEHDIANPRFARRSAGEIAAASRGLARCEKGSQRREKARRRLARVHAAVADRRRDHHHKTARRLAMAFDRIGVEDLRIKNLLANRRLARAIADAGWGEFLQILEHQARKAGGSVVRSDPRNTSQTCSACGTKAKSRLQLGDRLFCCHRCGLVLDRDRNAARNLDPGRAEPGEGDDGSKTLVPAGPEAA